MKRWLVTPAFCKSLMLKRCLEHLHHYTGLPADVIHVIIDNHYPVNKAQNRYEIQEVAKYFNCIYIDSGRDRGLHEGLNYALSVLNPSDDDFWIVVDPDDRPDKLFYQNMFSVMKNSQEIAILGTNFPELQAAYDSHKGNKELKLEHGHTIWLHHFCEMFNVTATRLSFIKEIGGFKEPFKYYGGLESDLYPEWNKRKMRLAYLMDSHTKYADKSDGSLVDKSYIDWKSLHIKNEFTGSFEEYLNANGQT